MRKLDDEIAREVSRLGKQRTLDILKSATADTDDSENVLTIISNVGVHHIPDKLKRGTVYVASKGNLDFSSIEAVEAQYREILSELAKIVKSRTWNRVYVIPFGHSTLLMQIKLLVFRITRIETIEVFYDGKGNYWDLELNQRTIAIEA